MNLTYHRKHIVIVGRDCDTEERTAHELSALRIHSLLSLVWGVFWRTLEHIGKEQ